MTEESLWELDAQYRPGGLLVDYRVTHADTLAWLQRERKELYQELVKAKEIGDMDLYLKLSLEAVQLYHKRIKEYLAFKYHNRGD